MQIQMVMFSEPKAGHAPGEWEDCACGGIVGDAAPGQVPQHARFVVVDGATEAYDSLRWVDQLVTSFALQADAAAAPRLEPAAMRAWFARMQDRWARESPTAFDSIIEERKFTEVGRSRPCSVASCPGWMVRNLHGRRSLLVTPCSSTFGAVTFLPLSLPSGRMTSAPVPMASLPCGRGSTG
jgi:hypothetical protein